jgi:hypothetical protein
MDRHQNKIIKLLEKIVEQNQRIINDLNQNPFVKPYNPPPYTPPVDRIPAPFYQDTVTCMHCGKDTGIPMMLHMVIPPEGLKCRHCGNTAVYSMSPTCQEPFSTEAVPYTTTLKPWNNPWNNISTCSSGSNDL